ncbi:Coiled-coil domain-containing protein 30 [Nibea albiflora]|uniref:Coiled-coil domain-containing protein 30 n=1 Tax=Nibea albiflora TaxID=240163 RepID=A0ACB7EZQ6_NIBAL|nr:Coiled-coil domain-containing protein 30 [Nibea albiflora]
MTTWFTDEGLAPDSSKEAQLCFLWRALQCTRSRLSGVTWDLDTQRSQHLAEMAEVRKSLEQIRIFTEHKDVLAQEIQDENDQLKDQLRRLISLQDSQISEVAKMLYQQGLTELIHSSPSEQVAYLLVERASLLETSEIPDNLTGDGNTASLLGTEVQVLNASAHQAETQHLADQASSVGRECSRLERDLEEGSRRLAMAHNEIRRLTDELESAHLTQRAYEPELQAAQQEVEQLRQEVEKLKKYEMAELRKAKELNDRLDLEIRALRNRVRSLDAEKGSLQQTVVSLREKVERLESAKHAEQRLLTVQSQTSELAQSNQSCRNLQEELSAQMRCLLEKEETVVSLQREVERLESALHEQQQQAEQQLLTLQVQASQAKSKAAELIRSNDICRDLQNKLSSQTRRLLEKDSEIHSLKQQLDHSHKDLHKLIATICAKENQLQDQKLWEQNEAGSQHCEDRHCQLKDSFASEGNEQQTQQQLLLNKECPDYQEAVNTLLATQDQCETLKREICETLKFLDRERSKYHEIKEKHKLKLGRAKQKFDDETAWRDEKINNLERELSLCSHSLAKDLKKISNPMQVFTSLPVPTSSEAMPEPSEIQGVSDSAQSKQMDGTTSPHCFISGSLSRSAEMGYLNLTSAQSRSDYSAHPATLSRSSADSTCC